MNMGIQYYDEKIKEYKVIKIKFWDVFWWYLLGVVLTTLIIYGVAVIFGIIIGLSS